MEEFDLAFGTSVLDLGSGTGHYAVLWRAQGANVVCVDRSANMVEVLRSKKLESVCESFATLNLNREFDQVMAIGSLEFIENLQEGVDCLCRHLRLGGRCLVMVPKDGLVGYVYKKVHELWGCSTYTHSRRYLLETFEASQFHLEKCKKGLISDIYVFAKH